jgi:hypothetical protein
MSSSDTVTCPQLCPVATGVTDHTDHLTTVQGTTTRMRLTVCAIPSFPVFFNVTARGTYSNRCGHVKYNQS